MKLSKTLKKGSLLSFAFLLAACGSGNANGTASSLTISSSPSATSSSALSSSTTSAGASLPQKSVFFDALANVGTSKHYKLSKYSYDTAFDKNMAIIEGKYTLSGFLSDVSLYDNDLYLSQAESLIYETPVDLLAEGQGTPTSLSKHDYYVQGQKNSILSIDDAKENNGETIGYALYEKDLIHSFDFVSSTFAVQPADLGAKIKEGRPYFDALVSADPENYAYDAEDLFVEQPIVMNSDGSYTYSFSVHFERCHYGDFYYINRRFTYSIDLSSSLSLLDYGVGIEVFDPIFDSNGALTGYAPDAGEKTIYSALSSASLGSYAQALPDCVSASVDSEENARNASGATLICELAPIPTYDMSTLTSDALKDSTVIASLASAMPSYLTWATHSEMTGSLTDGASGVVYEEKRSKSLYLDNLVAIEGSLKQTVITAKDDEDTGKTTYSYGAEEDATYSATLKLEAKSITTTHQETESTVYSYMDPLNGTSPMSTFAYGGDFSIPTFLPLTAQEYLDPSSLGQSLKLLTIDAAKSSVSTDGVLTVQATDYANNYTITIAHNQISQVVEKPLPIACAEFGSGATITKTYVLSAPTPIAYPN